MRKEELKKLRSLYATDAMMQKAGMDVPKKKFIGYGNRQCDSYKYGVYLRCQQLSGYLKVAFFLAEHMRVRNNRPVYELFINKESGEFITWDVVRAKWRDAKLDMLDWPEYTFHSGKYINPEGNKAIKKYLGVESGGYRGLLEYQISVRKDQLTQKHRRETSPWDLDMDQVPELPKDWEKWVDKCGITQNFIFYEYSRKGAKEGYCTWCEKEVPISRPKHNEFGICKCCGKKIQYKSRGKAGHFFTAAEPIYLMQKCEDGFVLRYFRAHRRYHKGEYESPERICSEIRRVIYDENLYPKTYDWQLYKNIETRWVKTDNYSYRNYYSYYHTSTYKGIVYKRTLPNLAKGILKRTGLVEHINSTKITDPETYLSALKSAPYIEQLAKIGLGSLVSDLIFTDFKIEMKDINDLGKKLNIDRSRLKRLRENDGGRLFLEWLQYEKDANKNFDDGVISYFDEQKIKPKDLDFIRDRMSETKIRNYLRKQYRLSGRSPKELLGTWEDYLCIANRLKMNTQLEIFFKPRNLIEGHDEVVKLCGGEDLALRAGEIAGKFPDIDEILASIKDKYEFNDKKYAIVVPEKIEDIITEGKVLGHCLDSHDIYFARIHNRESYIVFLRKVDEIETPYYTLEIEPGGSARQKRTTGDKQNKDFDEAKRFIEKWQIAIQKNLSESDKQLAKESAKLRVEEFVELRKQKAKIWRGHLAGKLLADVLEADLMEVAVG